MNASGMIRGYLAKNQSGEEFIKFVSNSIERQLKEWNNQFEVMLLKLTNYELIVQKEYQSYLVTISEDELDSLQSKSPFSLDRRIWNELQEQGIEVVKGTGNYLEYVNL